MSDDRLARIEAALTELLQEARASREVAKGMSMRIDRIEGTIDKIRVFELTTTRDGATTARAVESLDGRVSALEDSSGPNVKRDAAIGGGAAVGGGVVMELLRWLNGGS